MNFMVLGIYTSRYLYFINKQRNMYITALFKEKIKKQSGLKIVHQIHIIEFDQKMSYKNVVNLRY